MADSATTSKLDPQCHQTRSLRLLFGFSWLDGEGSSVFRSLQSTQISVAALLGSLALEDRAAARSLSAVFALFSSAAP